MSFGLILPSVNGAPALISSPSLTFSFEPNGITYVLASSFPTTVTSFLFLSSFIVTLPSISVIVAKPLGFLASNNSSTLGRPCVISPPATPPVWKVLIVSCVPGSPIDCAAMIPTDSPIATLCLVASPIP